METDVRFSIAQIVPATEAEGPGLRFAVWFQGCPLRCPGCCNPEFLPFQGGESKTLNDMLELLDDACRRSNVSGVSLLGGEPFAHAEAASLFAEAAQARGLSVMVYSGYTIEEIREQPAPASALLAATDLLVDGPYLRDQPDTERRWVGSTNQRLHFLSSRFSPSDPCWRQKNTLEIRVRGGEVSVNGFPAPGEAVGLWKPKWSRRPGPEKKGS